MPKPGSTLCTKSFLKSRKREQKSVLIFAPFLREQKLKLSAKEKGKRERVTPYTGYSISKWIFSSFNEYMKKNSTFVTEVGD